MRTSITLLIVFLASLTTTYSQYINQHGPSLYEAGGQIYEYADMESIFHQDSYALRKYWKSLRRKKSAKVLGIVTLGVVVGSFVALPVGSSYCDTICASDAIAASGLVVASITGTIALSHTISSSTNRRKAIRTINDLHAQDLGIQDDEWKIDLKVNTGSVGMVMTF